MVVNLLKVFAGEKYDKLVFQTTEKLHFGFSRIQIEFNIFLRIICWKSDSILT